jgi:NADPH-dependent glutamate synthase beta subunit-like oxidoreductase
MSDATTPAPPHISVSRTSTLTNRTGSWKYILPRYRDGVAPCNATCPTGVDVEGYMNLLRQDRVADAMDLLLRENPMPAVTGRVCHHPCETACNRASFDDAVAVHLVERELGDRILATRPQRIANRRRETIGIIGSGPAGLACAYHLTRLGYRVTVFEREASAGGMLRQGIPAYRLPRSVLDAQIAWFRAVGIDILCNAAVDAERTAAMLEKFDAVFIATGAYHGRPLGAEHEGGAGVLPGLKFLQAVNRGERPDVGRRVAVVGGGNTAMDCARAALRLGADVTVLYRRTRAEMPAIAAEIEDAEREGVRFEFLAAPRALVREGDRLLGVEYERMVLGEPDASGRRRPVPSGEARRTLPADTVLTAIGEDAALEAAPVESMAEGGIVVDQFGSTRVQRLWAGGDAAGVDRTVSAALGSGKAAAIGIDRLLRERAGEMPDERDPEELRWSGGNFSMSRWRGDDPVRRTGAANETVDSDTLNPAYFAHVPRAVERVRQSVAGFGEVNLGLSPVEAMAEAKRCLNCGVCNECEVCLILCPDVAISRAEDGGFIIDMEHCKGCGVCASECPRGAIVMVREAQ